MAELPTVIHMFRTEFAIHVQFKGGWTTFRREEELPFAPFIGLDVLDDSLGEFQLEHVAWYGPSKLFLCQSQLIRADQTLRQVQKVFKKSAWIEDIEATGS